MLLDQRGGLEYLRVGHESVLHVLELASWGWFEWLKTLDLSTSGVVVEEGGDLWSAWTGPSEETLETNAGLVARALIGGGLRDLEELNMRGAARMVGPRGREVVMDALKTGVCPNLRRLYISGASSYKYDEGARNPVADALESGHLRHLEELDLSQNKLGHEGVEAIARALQEGACPHLTYLNLEGSGISHAAGPVLGEVMRSGRCGMLRHLNIGENRLASIEGLGPVISALEAGGCPSLRSLGLHYCELLPAPATTLSQAVRSVSCRQLQYLTLEMGLRDRTSSFTFLQGLQQGALPSLIFVDLTGCHMNQEHGGVLGGLIHGGALPQLETLIVPFNPLGDGGMVPIMDGLEAGGCRNLKTLDMRGVDMGPHGGHALADALYSGNIPLQELRLGDNHVEDEAMARVIKELRICHQLRHLVVRKTGAGISAGQVLVQALQHKDWPEVEKLDLSGNVYLLSDEGVVVGLVGVLERRADLCPRLKRVYLGKSGLDKEGEGGKRLAKLLQNA